MISFKELFIDLKPMSQSIDIANGASMIVTGIGNVQLDALTSTGEQLRIELHNVIYAPTSPYNLLSVSQILSRGHTLIMNKSERCIRIHDRISIPIALFFWSSVSCSRHTHANSICSSCGHRCVAFTPRSLESPRHASTVPVV
jgi:hypothetical protein